MKRQRAFLDQTSSVPPKKVKTVSIVPLAPKLNKTQELQVKRLLAAKEELKVFQAGIQNESIGIATANISSLANIVQGVLSDGRIGDEISYRYLKFTLAFTMADTTNVFRLIIFKWKDNTAYSAPTMAKILKPDVSGVVTPYSFYNDNEKQSYVILLDQFFSGNVGSSSSKLITSRTYKLFVKGKARYTADASIDGTNKLYRLMISDSAGVPHVNCYWMSEVGYTDS